MADRPLQTPSPEIPRTAFLRAATWHGSLEEAERWLTSHPELSGSDIHTAAVVGDAKSVRKFLDEDPANATATSEPYGATALVYLGLSKYLRLDPMKSDGFIDAATALLDAGADPNAGFWSQDLYPEWETALYGAAGVAHHAGITRLLLEHGADPNDGDTVYHSPETHDNDAMKLLVETGKLTTESLSIMLIRKHDWHDYEGAKYLLEHGADPNGIRTKGWYPLHHALARDNHTAFISLLLDHGADPAVVNDGISAVARAARQGRSDVLALFAQKGIPVLLHGVDELIAACAMGDIEAAKKIIKTDPDLLRKVLDMSGELLAKFSGTGNLAGVGALLDIGVAVNTPFLEGDGYFEIPPGSLAIHVAAWRERPPIVQLLIDRGAHVDVADNNGRTPLALAVLACVDSYWTDRRSPDSVKALLDAGASVNGIPFPSGYREVDALLQQHQ